MSTCNQDISGVATRELSIDNGGRNDHLQMETVEERDEDHISSLLPALSP